MDLEASKTAFVTFYSFKGGVGRSMALINTAGILVGRGFHVLVIDLDLEAPGLSYLNPDAPDVSPLERTEPVPPPPQPGFVDLLLDAKQRGEASDLFTLSVGEFARRYTRPYPLPDKFGEFADGSLHIMPAGKLDEGYIQRFNALNLPQLYADGEGEPLIRFFKTKLVESGRYDYVLVDSRTGFSDEAGICTRDLPDHLMILSGLNHQNVEGTCGFLRALREQSKESLPSFDIILSPVPNGEDQLVDKRAAIAGKKFTEAWGDTVTVSLQIPYHPQLALTEEPHIFRRRHGYLTEAYRAIETRLLQALGHTAKAMLRAALRLASQKDYRGALRLARQLIRLDGGRPALDQLAYSLAEPDWQSSVGSETREQGSSKRAFRDLVSDAAGRELVEFIVEHVSVLLGGWAYATLLRQLRESSPELADKLYLRLVAATPEDADHLGNYATFLKQRGRLDEAETYYQRALQAAPEHANNLGNYAVFLEQRGRLDEAETYYQRALHAAPEHANNLGNYATFLPRRDRLDEAETYFQQALEAAPEHANNLGNYATFLQQRGRLDEAETYYQRAFQAAPEHASNLGNYGQVLVGIRRVDAGIEQLTKAFAKTDSSQLAVQAEVAFSIWLARRLQARNATDWEQAFKFLIQADFPRSPWNFTRMLAQAAEILDPAEYNYAVALSQAFLDASKVPDLDRFDRWRNLEPLDPAELRRQMAATT